jgi:transcriptional regulator with XRE-family HTH domain
MIPTSKTLILELMDKHQLPSMYAVAKLMGRSPQTVANWMQKGSTLDNESARIAANLLNLDFEYVLICMEAERAKKNPVTALAWVHVAEAWNKSKPMMASAVFAVFSVCVFYPSSGLV